MAVDACAAVGPGWAGVSVGVDSGVSVGVGEAATASVGVGDAVAVGAWVGRAVAVGAGETTVALSTGPVGSCIPEQATTTTAISPVVRGPR